MTKLRFTLLLVGLLLAEPFVAAHGQAPGGRRRPFSKFRKAASRPSTRPAQPVAGEAGSQPASQAAASQPQLTPEEEAELAIDLCDDDRIEEGLSLAKSAMKRSERPGVALLAMAWAYDAKGLGYEALEYARRYVDVPIGKNDWRGHALIGSILLRSRNYLSAKRSLDEAEKLCPRNMPLGIVSIASNKAEALVALNQKAEAEKTIREVKYAIAGFNEVSLWLAYGRVLFNSAGMNKEVEDVLNTARTIAQDRLQRTHSEDRVALSEMLSVLRTHMECLREEVSIIDEAKAANTKIDPERAAALPDRLHQLAIIMGGLLQMQQRAGLVDALIMMRRSVNLAPANVEYKNDLAVLQVQIGDRGGAETTLKLVLAQDPGNKKAQAFLEQLRRTAPTPSSAPASGPATGASGIGGLGSARPPASAPADQPVSAPDTASPPTIPSAAVRP